MRFRKGDVVILTKDTSYGKIKKGRIGIIVGGIKLLDVLIGNRVYIIGYEKLRIL